MAEFDFSESKRTSYSGRFPVFWRDNVKMLPGGFKLDNGDKYPAGTVIFRGAPLHIDFSAMTAKVVSVAKIASVTGTAVSIPKQCYFYVGQEVSIYNHLKNDTVTFSTTIKSIDTTSSDTYDIVTLAEVVDGLAEGKVLIDATIYTAGKTAAAVNVADGYVNALVGEDSEIKAYGVAHVDPCYEAVVLEPCLPWEVLDTFKQGIALKANPNIIFIRQ